MSIETDIAIEAKTAEASLLAKYAASWPYWTPVVILAAILGQYV